MVGDLSPEEADRMAWQPDENQLRQLAGYLRDTLSGRDQNAQKYATMVSRDQSSRAHQEEFHADGVRSIRCCSKQSPPQILPTISCTS